MVEEKSPETADRPQGLLNRRYRRYLLGESDIEPRTQAERDIRMNIRQRLYNGLLDFVLVYQHIEQRDIGMALDELEGDDRLNRDEAMANAMALFLDLGSGEEIADASQFERTIERAATISWHNRHPPREDGDVWLGGPRPQADLTVEYPDRIDVRVLMRKAKEIHDRYEEAEQERGDENLGEGLGLDALSVDEVLYMFALVETWNRQQDADITDGTRERLDILEKVATIWVVWEQDQRNNLSEEVNKMVAERRMKDDDER